FLIKLYSSSTHLKVDLSNLPLIFSSFKPFERFWICRFFRSGFDMQAFHIWKTSGTTYLTKCTRRLPGSFPDDFQEVFQTTSISVFGLPGSRLGFLKVFWTSWKSYGLPGSLLTKSSSISSGVQVIIFLSHCNKISMCRTFTQNPECGEKVREILCLVHKNGERRRSFKLVVHGGWGIDDNGNLVIT
ncbi:hypothetical protein IGI04_023321, partial [Brassica rapa subsp. trilocularis]